MEIKVTMKIMIVISLSFKEEFRYDDEYVLVENKEKNREKIKREENMRTLKCKLIVLERIDSNNK